MYVLVCGAAVANGFLYPPCVSSEGKEDRGCGPAKAAAVRDRAHCENVWGPGDNQADAVHQVKSVICLINGSIFPLYFYYCPKTGFMQ